MIVTCPACNTRYELSETALATSRKVRCKQCQHIWMEPARASGSAPEISENFLSSVTKQSHQEPEIRREAAASRSYPSFDAALESVEPARDVINGEQEPEAMPSFAPNRKSSPVPAKSKNAFQFSWVTLGWLAFGALAILLIAVLVAGKDRIAGRWPAVIGLYSSVGLTAGPRSAGLEIQHASMEIKDQDGKSSLVIKGQIINTTDAERRLLPIHIRLRDAQEKTVTSWSVKPRVARVAPNGSAPFETELPGSREIVSSELVIGP